MIRNCISILFRFSLSTHSIFNYLRLASCESILSTFIKFRLSRQVLIHDLFLVMSRIAIFVLVLVLNFVGHEALCGTVRLCHSGYCFASDLEVQTIALEPSLMGSRGCPASLEAVDARHSVGDGAMGAL